MAPTPNPRSRIPGAATSVAPYVSPTGPRHPAPAPSPVSRIPGKAQSVPRFTPNPPAPGLVKSPVKDSIATVPVASASAADHIKNMQQFLKNRGYPITVDGIRGPQTNAIIAAFHKGVSAQQYNAAKGKANAPAVKPAGNPGSQSPGVQPRRPGAGGNTGGGATAPAVTTAAVNPNDPFAIDPQKYASSAANAQYDPTISALQQQLDQLDPQHKQNAADILSWFKQIQGDNSQAATDTAAFDKTNLAGYDQSAQNIAQLFGGAAAPDFSGFANIGRSELTGLADSQGAFQKNMGTILGAQGADALRQESGMYSHNKSDLMNQLGAQRSAKGQAYTADLQTGYDNAQKAEIAKQTLALAQGQQPYQIATAKAQAAAAKAQAIAAKADATNASATSTANLKLINARVAQAQAAAKAAGGTWNLNNPNDRGSLSQALRTSIGNKQGWLRVSPSIALSNIQAALDQAGLGSDPQAKEIADSVFQEVLNNSHSAKLFRNVTYVNGKLVTKAKAKPKK